MNSLEMKGRWNIVRGRVKQHWAKLTDDDLQFAEGKEIELVGRIQERTGRFQENASKDLTTSKNLQKPDPLTGGRVEGKH